MPHQRNSVVAVTCVTLRQKTAACRVLINEGFCGPLSLTLNNKTLKGLEVGTTRLQPQYVLIIKIKARLSVFINHENNRFLKKSLMIVFKICIPRPNYRGTDINLY